MSKQAKREARKRWVFKRINRAGLQEEFKESLREQSKRLRTSHRDNGQLTVTVFKNAANKFPVTDLKGFERHWERQRINIRKCHLGKTGAKIARRIKNCSFEIRIRMRKHKEQENLERMKNEALERRAKSFLQLAELSVEHEKRAESAANARLSAAQKELSARASLHRIEKHTIDSDVETRKRIGNRKKDMQKLARSIENTAPAASKVKSVDVSDVNITRDILWVYENLRALLIRSDSGAIALDDFVLAKAPSSGAISLAELVVDVGQQAFMREFVQKVLSKEKTTKETDFLKVNNEEKPEVVDPTIGDLDEYMK